MLAFLEATMLICFGISWPFNLYKSIKSKTAKGKSVIFLSFIDVGYIAGILWKLLDPAFDWPNKWWIFALYVLNFCMVTADFIMYFINRNRDKKASQQ